MSMKYFLVIWVCSFVNGADCGPTIKHSTPYNSWYECSVAAHLESVRLIKKIGSTYVDQFKIGTKYTCRLEPDGV